jgi:hypothetical protein
MDEYGRQITNLLINNLGISRDELFVKSGIISKYQFVRVIQHLIEEGRISKAFDPYNYAPRVHIVVEQNSKALRKYRINFLSTDVLEKGLNFKRAGSEPEDELEYYLQVAGLPLKKENLTFLTGYCNINFNFDDYFYYLWAIYLLPGTMRETWDLVDSHGYSY